MLRYHGIDYDIYVYNTQLCITFDLSDPTNAVENI